MSTAAGRDRPVDGSSGALRCAALLCRSPGRSLRLPGVLFGDEAYAAVLASGQCRAPDGLTASVAFKTTGRAAAGVGKAAMTVTFDHGTVVDVVAGAAKSAAVTLEGPWALVRDIVEGRADPAVPYMSGDLKVSGSHAAWLSLLQQWQQAGALWDLPDLPSDADVSV